MSSPEENIDFLFYVLEKLNGFTFNSNIYSSEYDNSLEFQTSYERLFLDLIKHYG